MHCALALTVPGTPHAQAVASHPARYHGLGSLLMHALGRWLLSYPSGSISRQRRIEVARFGGHRPGEMEEFARRCAPRDFGWFAGST